MVTNWALDELTISSPWLMKMMINSPTFTELVHFTSKTIRGILKINDFCFNNS